MIIWEKIISTLNYSLALLVINDFKLFQNDIYVHTVAFYVLILFRLWYFDPNQMFFLNEVRIIFRLSVSCALCAKHFNCYIKSKNVWIRWKSIQSSACHYLHSVPSIRKHSLLQHQSQGNWSLSTELRGRRSFKTKSVSSCNQSRHSFEALWKCCSECWCAQRAVSVGVAVMVWCHTVFLPRT